MIPYHKYSSLLGRKYELGFTDCYSLVRGFYQAMYGIHLPNYARPEGYALNPELSIFSRILANPDFVSDSPKGQDRLREGDVLIFRVASDQMNHLGVYVGNGLFIHHLHNGVSREDNLDQKWYRRILLVARHVDVKPQVAKKGLDAFLSPYFRQGSSHE